jgi:hypothetical protein
MNETLVAPRMSLGNLTQSSDEVVHDSPYSCLPLELDSHQAIERDEGNPDDDATRDGLKLVPPIVPANWWQRLLVTKGVRNVVVLDVTSFSPRSNGDHD